MKISTKTRYGLQLLSYLAIHKSNGKIQLSEIAKSEEISIKYLEQIVTLLRPLNLLNSSRGSKGGYSLQKDPAQITLDKIFYALEGDYQLVPAQNSNSSTSRCTQPIWNDLQKLIDAYLKNISLEKIIENYNDINNMYYI